MTDNNNLNNVPSGEGQTPTPDVLQNEQVDTPVSQPAENTEPTCAEPPAVDGQTDNTAPPPSQDEQQKDEGTPSENNGEYTWQNPNPYNEDNPFDRLVKAVNSPPPKRKRISGIEIALIAVSAITVILLMMVIALVMTKDNNGSKLPLDNENEIIFDDNDDNDLKDDDDSDKDDDDDESFQRPTENLPTLETQKPSSDALSIPEVYNKVKDSVVGIAVVADGAQGSGTGIILSEDGFISTNAHVVEGASSIKVVLTDHSEHKAQLIGIDSRTDLAVIKIDKTGLQPAEFGDSDSLIVGETVVAIGNPYGIELAGTVTSGIVSAVNRQIVIDSFYMTLIQTDASINPGNSGGPLVNSFGQVIGITSSKIVQSGYEGIGFAIPMSGATDIIQDLIQYGYIKDRPYIGITGYDITESEAKMYDIPQGVRVHSVDPDSDASEQGVMRDDIIIAVDDVEVKSMAELDSEKNKKKPGDSLTLTVYRNGKKKNITIKLSEAPAE